MTGIDSLGIWYLSLGSGCIHLTAASLEVVKKFSNSPFRVGILNVSWRISVSFLIFAVYWWLILQLKREDHSYCVAFLVFFFSSFCANSDIALPRLFCYLKILLQKRVMPYSSKRYLSTFFFINKGCLKIDATHYYDNDLLLGQEHWWLFGTHPVKIRPLS